MPKCHNPFIFLVFLLIFSVPAFCTAYYDDPGILYDYNLTIPTTYKQGMSMDLDAYMWLVPTISEYRYILIENRNSNWSAFTVHRVNPNSFALEYSNSSTSHQYARIISKPQDYISNNYTDSQYKLGLLALESTYNISFYTYSIIDGSVNWLGNITRNTSAVKDVQLSEWIVTNGFTPNGFQQYALVVYADSSTDPTLYYDWIVNGTMTNITNSANIGTFTTVEKAYLTKSNGICRVLSGDCIFSIIYLGQPTVSDHYGIWAREFRKGFWGLEYADIGLKDLDTDDANDISAYKFYDPFALRDYIVLNRITNGTQYCRDVFDINFSLYSYTCYSDSVSFSPTWFQEVTNITVTHNGTNNISDVNYSVARLPNRDAFYVTVNPLGFYGSPYAYNYYGVSLNVTIFNTTDSYNNYQYILPNLSFFPKVCNMTVTFKVPLPSAWRNKTDVELYIRAIYYNSTDLPLWIGYPKTTKWVYVQNANDITVGNEIGFYIVPFITGNCQAYLSSRENLQLQYQDLIYACVCDPWYDQSCVNSTHRRQIRTCYPSACDSIVQFTADVDCYDGDTGDLETGDLPEGSIITLECSDYTTEASCVAEIGCEWSDGVCSSSDIWATISLFLDYRMLATFALIIISVLAGMKVNQYTQGSSGSFVSIIVAVILILMFSVVGIYPAWIGIVLIVLAVAIMTYFGYKTIAGG